MSGEKQQCLLHQEQLNDISQDVKAIKKILLGNGVIGICGKVDIIWGIGIFVIVGLSVTVGTFIWGILIK